MTVRPMTVEATGTGKSGTGKTVDTVASTAPDAIQSRSTTAVGTPRFLRAISRRRTTAETGYPIDLQDTSRLLIVAKRHDENNFRPRAVVCDHRRGSHMRRIRSAAVSLLALGFSACAVVIGEDGRLPEPVIVAPRALDIPPGHYPPPDHCRVLYAGRPPGQQPPPVRCDRVSIVPGAFMLYEHRAWDLDYDWRAHARRQPGSVPRVIIDLTGRRSPFAQA
jgi:hypothetical protein